jgi:AraC family transcriptional regulator, positive regulator of tynA and feaB
MPAVYSDPPLPADSRLRAWTTSQARPHERLDYWVGAICEAFLEMDCSSREADCFDGQLVHLPLERLAVNRVKASTQDVYRTPAGIARSAAQPFYLITQTDRPWAVKQGGRLLQLRPGDAVLVDAAQTYELHFPHSVSCLSVQMPRTWVVRWLKALDVPEARVAHREQGWGAMLSALCLQLGREPGLALQMAPDWLEAQFGALLSASLEPQLHREAAASRDLHDRAVAHMRDACTLPGWRAADLAAQLGVSLRSLHRSFTGVGDTVMGCWRRLRVERACALLDQPRLAALPIAEIALRCGYTDASHFARDFQRVTGQTPLRWARSRRGR